MIDDKTYIKMFEADVDDKVTRLGHILMGIFGDEEALPFSYSVGLAEKGSPELLVIGVDGETGRAVINGIVENYSDRKEPVVAGLVHPDGFPYPFMIIEVPDETATAFTMQAYHRADRIGMPRSSVKVLQLVWTDTDGRFPWHAEYNQGFRQTVLGVSVA